jgi:hypothetical protein
MKISVKDMKREYGEEVAKWEYDPIPNNRTL